VFNKLSIAKHRKSSDIWGIKMKQESEDVFKSQNLVKVLLLTCVVACTMTAGQRFGETQLFQLNQTAPRHNPDQGTLSSLP
jgi:capsule polysaccharide export protein KpsE/RkpR